MAYNWEQLRADLKGELFTDETYLSIYSTDASAYREKPVAVVYPACEDDILHLIRFAHTNNQTLIPRGAGTSLAGQVVGKGIVVDISKNMTEILEINPDERWVRVQPGVILDELNMKLKFYGLFFAPETSTSNRCTIGGMIGNNSSGLHSLIYRTTREHLISVKAFLSDGSLVEFGDHNKTEFLTKCQSETLEGKLYQNAWTLLSKPESLEKINSEYPDKSIIRRNTGYALDELSDCMIFNADSNKPFNFCRLIAGSEGTLAFITEAKLNLLPLPSKFNALVCVHLYSVIDAVRANLIALKYKPGAIELMDNKILELTSKNIEQRKNRFFLKGNPGAILMVEFISDSMDKIEQLSWGMEKEMRDAGLGYHFPLVTGKDISKVWNLRKAGLGVLSNLPGDAKPVSVIEDTSVSPKCLENYIHDINALMQKYQLECVFHAHISVGELHLRPILNLKSKKDTELYREVALETARLVKKYRGSLSGEHGDGRLRGEFIPIILGEEITEWFRQIKKIWDPENIFNYGKIVNTPPMNTFLRYKPGQVTREIPTIFDFSAEGGIQRAIEKCNGSADCRKSELIGGTMCPSYMATLNENNTTRARANLLREFLIKDDEIDPFNHKELYNILDLCLSCKGCKSECPSNVDMAKLKAEFLQNYYDRNGIPVRSRLIAYITEINRIGMIFPAVFNFFVTNKLLSGIIKKSIGFAKERTIPKLHKYSLRSWARQNLGSLNSKLSEDSKKVYLFIDEFTNYNDVEIGIKTILLLSRLNYIVLTAPASVSGRTFISKGLLRAARKIAIRNITSIAPLIDRDIPLIGIEPSAILSFRDEYPELIKGELVKHAKRIAKNTFTIDEFLAGEIEAGRINSEKFTKEIRSIKLHGHCQQKSIASTEPTKKILSLPENYSVEEIKSGCCGMAGSFGYEKEHYELSMKIGELVLFPEIRKSGADTIIAAPGTSCREQIFHGTGIKAMHPVEVLYHALI